MLGKLTIVPAQTKQTAAELAAALRPPLLRLTRRVRNQRVDVSVSLAQLSAMDTLRTKSPKSAGDLAACERVQPPSMTKIRQAIIVLTQAGSDLLESERRQRTAWLAQRIAKLTADERGAIRDVIPVLDKLAEL